MAFKREKLYSSLDNIEYTIFSVEEGETLLGEGKASDVLAYINGMITELNENLGEGEGADSLCLSLKDAIERSEYYGIKIVDRNNEENKVVVSLIEQALKFNHSWIGETKRKEYESYFNFSIKPLYMGDTDYIIQVVCNLMCPSGISDNGIKYVEQYTINRHAFKDINHLCKTLVRWTIRNIQYNNMVKYIQF